MDAISALGGYELPMDEWGIDVLVAGSQKAMMLPPGLAFAALSPKAWEFVKKSTLPKYYFDFTKQLKSQGKNQTPYTSPVSLILGLQEVLAKIKKVGPGKDLCPQPAAVRGHQGGHGGHGPQSLLQGLSLGGPDRGGSPGRG